jgi:hypothetical protein
VLADTGAVDRVRAGDLADPLDHVLRRQRAVRRFLVAERIPLAQVVQCGPPVGQVTAPAGVVFGRHGGGQLVDDVPGVAHDRDVGVAVLADLGRVDVGVHDGRVRRERVQLARHPVVEPGAERHDQVGLLQRVDGGDGAVHPRHAHVLPVRVGKPTAGHQRRDHR